MEGRGCCGIAAVELECAMVCSSPNEPPNNSEKSVVPNTFHSTVGSVPTTLFHPDWMDESDTMVQAPTDIDPITTNANISSRLRVVDSAATTFTCSMNTTPIRKNTDRVSSKMDNKSHIFLDANQLRASSSTTESSKLVYLSPVVSDTILLNDVSTNKIVGPDKCDAKPFTNSELHVVNAGAVPHSATIQNCPAAQNGVNLVNGVLAVKQNGAHIWIMCFFSCCPTFCPIVQHLYDMGAMDASGPIALDRMYTKEGCIGESDVLHATDSLAPVPWRNVVSVECVVQSGELKMKFL